MLRAVQVPKVPKILSFILQRHQMSSSTAINSTQQYKKIIHVQKVMVRIKRKAS